MLGSKSVLVALERYSERVPWIKGGVIGVIFVTKVSIEFSATRHEGDGIETQTCL
jgi:lysozyme family protein